MWWMWFLLGFACGGAVAVNVAARGTKASMQKFIRSLVFSLETEEQYPRSKGSTKKTLESLLEEFE